MTDEGLNGLMIVGGTNTFFSGSRAFLRSLSNADYNDQRVVVKKYVKEKERWAVELVDRRFNGKQILIKGEQVVFENFVLPPSMHRGLPSYLALCPWADTGHALFTLREFQIGEVVFEEYPLMVAAGESGFERRWRVVHDTEKQYGRDSIYLQAFEKFVDGGVVQEYVQEATSLYENVLPEIMTMQEMMELQKNHNAREFVEAEILRIAKILARWQTNSHAFPVYGSGNEATALFPNTAKMQHSCEANCAISVDPEQGIMSVRACQRITPGDQLTVSYMDLGSDFHKMAVGKRREALHERGFTCLCSRCTRESGESPLEKTPRAILEAVRKAVANIADQPTVASKGGYEAADSVAAKTKAPNGGPRGTNTTGRGSRPSARLRGK